MSIEHAQQQLNEGIKLIISLAKELEDIGGECAMHARGVADACLILESVAQDMVDQSYPEFGSGHTELDDIPF